MPKPISDHPISTIPITAPCVFVRSAPIKSGAVTSAAMSASKSGLYSSSAKVITSSQASSMGPSSVNERSGAESVSTPSNSMWKPGKSCIKLTNRQSPRQASEYPGVSAGSPTTEGRDPRIKTLQSSGISRHSDTARFLTPR